MSKAKRYRVVDPAGVWHDATDLEAPEQREALEGEELEKPTADAIAGLLAAGVIEEA